MINWCYFKYNQIMMNQRK